MEDPPRRPRLPFAKSEPNLAPVRAERVLGVGRKPTPAGLPVLSSDRASHDDVERVLETERLERERALLLTQLQDTQQALEAAQEQLRRPAQGFPPPVATAATKEPERRPSLAEIKRAEDIKSLEKALVGSRFGRGAIAAGVLLALAWNAFNSVRQRTPEQKVAAVQERLQQNERLSVAELQTQALERDRNLRRLRALECSMRQLRELQRQSDEEPGRRGNQRPAPAEKCPDFPPIPPEMGP